MNRKRFYISAAFILIIGVFVGLALSSRLEMTSSLTPRARFRHARSRRCPALRSLSEVAGVATPSVVNISSTRVIKQSEQAPYDFFDDPFFRRFFGDQFPILTSRRSKRNRVWAPA